jgi:hypothetical protein
MNVEQSREGLCEANQLKSVGEYGTNSATRQVDFAPCDLTGLYDAVSLGYQAYHAKNENKMSQVSSFLPHGTELLYKITSLSGLKGGAWRSHIRINIRLTGPINWALNGGRNERRVNDMLHGG